MEHFVIINDWCDDQYGKSFSVISVAHSQEEAEFKLRKEVEETMKCIPVWGYKVIENCDTEFYAADPDDRENAYTRLYIQYVRN